MKKFSSMVSEKFNKYGMIMEDAAGGGMPTGSADATSVPDAPAPAPNDQSPTPAQGAQPQKASYDKPYQDLGKILYKALRLDFDDLGSALQQQIMNLKPDQIDSDEQGVALFKEVEKILNEQQGTEPNQSGFGPGANKM